MANTYRIRRCKGNTDAFILIRLLADGQESPLGCDMFTSNGRADLLTHAPENLKPVRGDHVEIYEDVWAEFLGIPNA